MTLTTNFYFTTALIRNKLSALCILLLAFACSPEGSNNNDNNNPSDPKNNGTPALTVKSLSIPEGNTEKNVFLEFTLSAFSQSEVSFTISIKDNTTKVGEDYRAVPATKIQIPAGKFNQSFAIKIIGDTKPEPNEQFNVEISGLVGATFSADQKITITLLDDDGGSGSSVVGNPNIPTTGKTSPTSYSGMSLLWQDEFNGSTIDETKWNFEIGNGNNGWGNRELQFYRKENAYIKDGHLVIEAKLENWGGRKYTSTRMTTQGKFDFKYGRVDIRAALPLGQGMWPALWMLGSNFSTVGWPRCGEIDIMEFVGKEPTKIHGTLHWANQAGERVCTCIGQLGGASFTKNPAGSFTRQFHVYSIIWTNQTIRFLVDDQQYGQVNITPADLSEFQEKFFFIFNVAVGGQWPGNPDNTTTFPQFMIVDYVRVFQSN